MTTDTNTPVRRPLSTSVEAWLDAVEAPTSPLRPTSRHVAMALAFRARDPRAVSASMKRLTEATALSRRTVRRAVRELEAAGFLARVATTSQLHASHCALTIPTDTPADETYMSTNKVPWNQVRPGDFADHVSRELDPRRVTRVDRPRGLVWLDLLGEECGPFPARNYDYSRFDAEDASA